MTIIKPDYEVLDLLCDEVNQEFFKGELPEVVLTVQRHKKAYGHFRPFAWDGDKHEVNISANYFKGEPFEILVTLHHEMIHVHNFNVYGKVKDVVDNKRHNDKFRQACVDFDLFVEENEEIGYVTPRSLEKQSERWQEWYKQMVEKYDLTKYFKTCFVEGVGKKEPKSQFTGTCSETGKKVIIGRKVARELYESGDELYSPFSPDAVLEFDMDDLAAEFRE